MFAPCVSDFFCLHSGGTGALVAYAEADRSNNGASIGSSEIVSEKKKVVVLRIGWAGTSFLRNLNKPRYEVMVVSPHNYFAFTPIFPNVTSGLTRELLHLLKTSSREMALM
ncbi:hypothetical protein K1719_014531 [Acacia pycnantha]|nr:hypothetical protein K1719_014531 [Acacia pycnantha]